MKGNLNVTTEDIVVGGEVLKKRGKDNGRKLLFLKL